MLTVNKIYLDNSATTRISEGALEKYIEVSREYYGNPSSLHAMGFEAEKILDGARAEILRSLCTKDASVIFTASGSEANNLAIIGRALSKERYKSGAKIITTEGEHASVDAPLDFLVSLGFKVARIPTKNGKIDLDILKREMTRDVILVTMMMVNNETGALYDIATVSKIMKANSPDAFLHVDATQSYLKLPFTKAKLGADMITVSSHKIEGPKGVGALVVGKEVIKARGLAPIILGGGQEGGMRSGTENVPAVAAFGEAVKIGFESLKERYEKTRVLRDYLIGKFEQEELAEISLTLPEFSAPHILNITLPKIKSETMLHYLSSLGIYVSSGSACSSNGTHSSSALTAYGRSAAEADTSIRISLSYHNTKEEIDALAEGLASGLKKLSRIR
ncbi:MAG: cysteine desulfurase [Ruminococcaceae bacterium]|nr:cysteine desulfurase [Oscillospiraceae bacterium]